MNKEDAVVNEATAKVRENSGAATNSLKDNIKQAVEETVKKEVANGLKSAQPSTAVAPPPTPEQKK